MAVTAVTQGESYAPADRNESFTLRLEKAEITGTVTVSFIRETYVSPQIQSAAAIRKMCIRDSEMFLQLCLGGLFVQLEGDDEVGPQGPGKLSSENDGVAAERAGGRTHGVVAHDLAAAALRCV